MTPLSPEQIAAELSGSPWQAEGKTMVREFQCADFAGAIALINVVAELAEQADHHPDILLHSYNRLRISLSTHSAGGLTAADFKLARAIDAAS